MVPVEAPPGAFDFICRSTRGTRSGAIYDHSYRPHPVFYAAPGERVKKLQPYFGMELEMEFNPDDQNPNHLRRIAEKVPAHWYCKSDGSLSYGIEFVSMPMTWDRWRMEDWKWIPKGAAAHQTSTCGMHIHVSRSALSSLHIWKLLTFFSRNERYVYRFSRRNAARFNQWSAVDQDKWLINQKAKGGQGDSRYRALNTMPANTVEVRIFRGTCNPARAMENLAWTVGMVEFTRRASIRELSPRHFERFLKGQEAQSILTPKHADKIYGRSKGCA